MFGERRRMPDPSSRIVASSPQYSRTRRTAFFQRGAGEGHPMKGASRRFCLKRRLSRAIKSGRWWSIFSASLPFRALISSAQSGL